MGLSRDSPSIFLRFPGNVVDVLPFPWEKTQHINKFDPHPFPGQSRKVAYVYWFFSPDQWGFWGVSSLPPGYRPFASLLCLFWPFPQNSLGPGKSGKRGEQGLFLRYLLTLWHSNCCLLLLVRHNMGFAKTVPSLETDLLPLLMLTRWGRSTGKNQYW